jgi:uncharacterized protein YaiI (UPF0178 family)
VVGKEETSMQMKLVGVAPVNFTNNAGETIKGQNIYVLFKEEKWYTNENIDQMLMERHLNKKARRSSHKNHIKGPKKRTEDDDVRFAQSFEKLILMAKSKEGAQSGTI